MGGESPEDMAPAISNLLAYDGAQEPPTLQLQGTQQWQLVTYCMMWHLT
jgi:hypothetical protein